MADVFISYSRDDAARIAPIDAALASLGVSTWRDARLEAGGSFTEEIQRELHACRVQLVCWSEPAVRSQWVLGEAEIGRQRGVLLPVRLDAVTPPPPFNMMHADDLSAFDAFKPSEGWTKVLATLGAKLGRPGLVALWPLLTDATASQWKAWADANPGDPFHDQAWSRYEALHLDAEKNRIAEERAAARAAAEAEAARRAEEEARAVAERERLAKLRADAEAEAEAARSRAVQAASEPATKAERGGGNIIPFLLGAGALAVIATLGAMLYLRDEEDKKAEAPVAETARPEPVVAITPAAAAAMNLQGRYYAEGDEACANPLGLAVETDAEGEWLVLTSVVSSQVGASVMSAEAVRRERILAQEGETIRTHFDGGEALYRPTSDGFEMGAVDSNGASLVAGALWRRCS